MAHSVPPIEKETIFLERRSDKSVSREDILRMEIPSIKDCPTMYRPARNFLMIRPLPDQNISEGGIHLPGKSIITYNEGHIIAKGPSCVIKGLELGDCVTWAQHDEFILTIENYRFILIIETGILMAIPQTDLLAKKTGIGIVCHHCGGVNGNHKYGCPCLQYGPTGDVLSPEETVKELSELGHTCPDPFEAKAGITKAELQSTLEALKHLG